MNELALFGIMLVFSVLIFPGPLLLLGIRSSARRRAAAAAYEASYYAPAPEPEPAPRQQRRVDQAAYIAPAQAVYVAPVPITPPAPPAPAVKVLTFGETMAALVKGLHLLIVAESNAGKSTAAQAVLVGRVKTGDKVLVLDPHADPETWNGITAIGTGRNYAAIGTAMDQLLAEMNTRFQRKAKGDKTYAPLSIFVDEWPGIQSHCKDAGHFMTEMAQEGRKVKMRLVIMSQSDRVESLGIAGKGDVRGNFTFLFLGKKAVRAMPESATMTRPAVISEGDTTSGATVGGLDRFKSVLVDPQAVYALVSSLPAPVSEVEPASALLDFDSERDFWLGGTDGSGSGDFSKSHAQNQPYQQPEPAAVPGCDTDRASAVPASVPGIAPALLAEMEQALIEKYLTAGMSANAIAARFGGTRATRLAQIRAVRESMQPADEQPAAGQSAGQAVAA